jgi:hypothetical protein
MWGKFYPPSSNIASIEQMTPLKPFVHNKQIVKSKSHKSNCVDPINIPFLQSYRSRHCVPVMAVVAFSPVCLTRGGHSVSKRGCFFPEETFSRQCFKKHHISNQIATNLDCLHCLCRVHVKLNFILNQRCFGEHICNTSCRQPQTFLHGSVAVMERLQS